MTPEAKNHSDVMSFLNFDLLSLNVGTSIVTSLLYGVFSNVSILYYTKIVRFR